MNIHEYQAKTVLAKFGIPILKGAYVNSPSEARRVAKDVIGGDVWVVKAQIHAGGRGKGGGVKLAKSLDEVEAHAKTIIGMQLVTHQTGPDGKKVNGVLIEQGCAISHEYYLGIVLDRAVGKLCMMASSEGGMEIEKVAEKSPEKIIKEWFFPGDGLFPYQARNLAKAIGVPPELIGKAADAFVRLARCYVESDASLMEINPLVTTKDGQVIALDAKMNFDDNALFRHKDIVAMRDETEEDPSELEAHKYDLNFIKLDGTIGCMVNGAGLAMATMDIIKLSGGSPANFLDVGGGATKENVTAAFKIIMKDPNVKGILVNIFGGIMKCDIVAEGIIAATKEVGLKIPVVVRLEGTNVDRGKQLLRDSKLKLIPADDLGDAAKKIVAAVV
ncbi:MAG: ADP-forming succinate--CoA ligase subunit beta [Planctomycetaceae bacterium]|nr:ADP-forming succinate--CoA ligase subunit beta [Planctomycetaceae bacterium]